MKNLKISLLFSLLSTSLIYSSSDLRAKTIIELETKLVMQKIQDDATKEVDKFIDQNPKYKNFNEAQKQVIKNTLIIDYIKRRVDVIEKLSGEIEAEYKIAHPINLAPQTSSEENLNDFTKMCKETTAQINKKNRKERHEKIQAQIKACRQEMAKYQR